MRDVYRSVLSVSGVPRVLASSLLGRLPQGMSPLSILLLVRQHTGSFALAGAAVGAYALASAAGAPVQGTLADRRGRVRVLLPASAGQCLLLIALVAAASAGAPAGMLVLLAGLAGACAPPIAPCVRALWREAMPDVRTRETAYALEAVTQESIWIVGPLLVAAVITFASPALALLLVAVVSLVGTTWFVSSPLVADRSALAARHERRRALSSRGLRVLLGSIVLTGFSLGATEVGLPAVAVHAGSRHLAGVLLALWSVGSMAGGLWYGARRWRASTAGRYCLGLGAVAVFTAPLIAAHSIAAALVCSLVAGVTVAPVFSCQYTLVGRVSAPGAETETFTWVTAALVGGIAAGSAAGGAVVAAGGVGAPFLLASAAAALAAAWATVTRTLVKPVALRVTAQAAPQR